MAKASDKLILKGTIENLVYRNDKNDYTVMEIVTDDDELVCADSKRGLDS